MFSISSPKLIQERDCKLLRKLIIWPIGIRISGSILLLASAFFYISGNSNRWGHGLQLDKEDGSYGKVHVGLNEICDENDVCDEIPDDCSTFDSHGKSNCLKSKVARNSLVASVILSGVGVVWLLTLTVGAREHRQLVMVFDAFVAFLPVISACVGFGYGVKHATALSGFKIGVDAVYVLIGGSLCLVSAIICAVNAVLEGNKVEVLELPVTTDEHVDDNT
ncbi:unnamed protein product [Didymodactylos carnosus]|uniref:Uncharacterized protein n=1 Tax=Didymodactylos carnosus TaxID=1234261 RepID=A0A815BW05_9BILA|nr:unnamed protein product [Didymodactylos carnosus]CAF1383743.1 unnamed protein product [Didymodactylos carnosus]CAF4067218.1 unnamed protein product [Didymodactylos carnosus]CAF4191992.1 unnamed protein product [Didymodactylos carnosus]